MSQPPGPFDGGDSPQPPYGAPPEPQGWYPPPGYPPHPQGGWGYPAPVANGKATAALVTGVTTLVLAWCVGFGLVGLLAVFLGVRARQEIRASGGRQTGDGIALAGIVTGTIAAVVGLLALVVIIVAVLASPEAGTATFNSYA